MPPFVLDNRTDDHYVGCAAGNRSVVPTSFPNRVVIYKMKKKGETMIFDNDWDTVATINPASATGLNSLIVNGFPVDVRALSQDLCKHHLRANWLGYCFQEPALNSGRPSPTDPVNQYKRMNDMLNWLPYGARVNPQREIKPSIRWNRVDIINGAPVLYNLSDKEDLEECRLELKKCEDKVKVLEIRIKGLEDRTRVITNEKFEVDNRNKQLQVDNRNLNERNSQLQGENNRLRDELNRLRQVCNNRPVCIPRPPPVPTFVRYPRYNPCYRFRRC